LGWGAGYGGAEAADGEVAGDGFFGPFGDTGGAVGPAFYC
jgi:hypothetical protein